MKNTAKNRDSERGSATIKFLGVLAVILIIGNAAYNYIPVAYEAESMRNEMQTAVVQGMALPGKVNPVENVKARIGKAAQMNQVPADAVIEVKQAGNALTAHVTYVKKVHILPFGMFKYNYTFDHTATPTGFLMKQ
jgi:hypothetical protein